MNNNQQISPIRSQSELLKETQQWFSQMREQNHQWRSGVMGGTRINDEFFEEAKKRFMSGNNDTFSDFVKDNQGRFAQLLEDNGTKSIFDSFPNRPTSMCFEPAMENNAYQVKSSSVQGSFNRLQSLSSSTRSSSSSMGFPRPMENGSTTDSVQQVSRHASAVHHSSASMVRSSKSCMSTDGISEKSETMSAKAATMSATAEMKNGIPTKMSQQANCVSGNYSSHTQSPGRPTFSSPFRPSGCISLSSPIHKQQFHISASRSTFEYCGQTKSFKFSTDHVVHSYGDDSISESEDEDELSIEEIQSEPSEFDEESLLAIEDKPQLLAIEYDPKKLKLEKAQQMLKKIAMELLTTERTYVNILHLLDQIFAFRIDQENRVHKMFPPEVKDQMFANLKSLYQLHHDFLLPRLEERIAIWDKDQRIGDIMKNFAPFLKMYTEYIKNYTNGTNLVNIFYQKCPRFAQIMDEVHQLPECGNLTLHHHFITPVQRVPRYQLLLKDYLKHLPEESLDHNDTEKAMELVATAANHANEAMKKIDKFKKLLEIQEMIGGVLDLVSPSRELLKEGKIVKISARSGDHQERHLFLFTDLVLLCSQRKIGNRVISGPMFRLRAKLPIEGLIIMDGDNLETANTFYIRNGGRSIELYTQTHDEKQDWMETLAKTVHDLMQKKSSLKIGDTGHISPDGLELGQRAPVFVKSDGVNHCMICGFHFATFAFKRKHHCRTCGVVACNKCLPEKVPLPYDKKKAGKVCSQCSEILRKQHSDIKKPEQSEDSGSGKENLESPLHRKGVLEVKPMDPAVMNGYMFMKASNNWVRRWFALHDDFVLYSFKSKEEKQALTSMPVPGYTVELPHNGDNVDGRENVFKLVHKKKVYFFQPENNDEALRWVSHLEKAARAEMSS